ncbi:hypothetical protein [Thermoactinospora rubra]|uniref:hypothetical protein n=1 Tax=Thermoactinospora rubra TaxID=1088767 RepID=UPI00117C3B23|nr:hypothetical protein [Thermoactinospora rubra]
MGSSLVRSAEHIVSSARLAELEECSALLRRTRMRAQDIVDQAQALLLEAELEGEPERIAACADQYDQARAAYAKLLDAYLILRGRIAAERATLRMSCQAEPDGLVSGHA